MDSASSVNLENLFHLEIFPFENSYNIMKTLPWCSVRYYFVQPLVSPFGRTLNLHFCRT
jgi:hypothetical protein